jgi:hypothetical protein
MLLFLSLLAVSSVTVLAQCPPLGSTLPLASNLATNPTVKETIEGVDQLLKKYTASFDATAIVLTIGTTHDDAPLLEFYNAPTVYNTTGSHTVNTNTQFIIASISKLFTTYGVKLLSDKVNVTDPVTKFLPELLQLKKQANPENDITTTDWGSITIEALMSHMAGIAEDCKSFVRLYEIVWMLMIMTVGDEDIDNGPGNFSALGLPILNKTEQGIQCGDSVNPYQRPCTDAGGFFKALRRPCCVHR